MGTAPNTYNVARIRVRSATSAHLIVAENSDVAWADNYYLTVKREWLCWSIRPFINSSGTVFKDYDIAYTDQTLKWPPVAMMGDPVCKPWAGNPTSVYFDGSESYATSPGATITSYAWDFGDGTTSTAATPGNHNYTSAGDRWASLTVTDSNGKTCVTYRPVSLPDPATLYTAKFQEQSLDAAIDAGWTGQCSVFAPSATTTEFPERAPVFLIAVNTYGGTAGSVGYPRGRENVVLFGYIQDDSVEETPETSSIQFTMESVDKVAARAAAITTFVGDATTPANWDEGKSLNIFRSFVYLLAFQSTLFQIADVRLFNDTTLIKIARFPEDNLWNMFAQFARGARLMRVGVTRTGRVIVGRDPNLLPIASRGVVTTVCQLQDGDWADTVTIPEHPYPATSFLCLSGISYDGNPADDPTPLFGMSPGHPPKEYGTSREIHDLALVNQLEAEELAGLSVGQDNNAFGEVNIPLWANWIGAFDPAYQEYVRMPAGGFVTNRGTLLVGDYGIVRKVNIGFDWDAGAMRSTITCEVYSYPDIGMVGDCYTTDAPAPPPTKIPPVIPGPHPNPTGGGTTTFLLGLFTLFNGDDIYRVTSLSSGGGSAIELPKWKNTQHATNYTARDHAPAVSPVQNMAVENNNTTPPTLALARSTNDGVTSWSVVNTDLVSNITAAFIDSDHTNRNLLFAAGLGAINQSAVAATVSGTGEYLPSGAPVDFYANTGEISVWYSTDGGANWTKVFLDFLAQLLPSRVMAKQSPFSTLRYGSPGNPGFPFDFCLNYDAGRWIDTTTVPWTNKDYKVCDPTPFHDVINNVNVYDPESEAGGRFMLMLANNNNLAYVCAPGVYVSQTHVFSSVPGTVDETATTPAQMFNAMQIPFASLTRTGYNFIYSITKTGTKVGKQLAVSDYSGNPFDVFVYGACDPTATGNLYFTTVDHELVKVVFSSLAVTLTSIGGGGAITGIIITTQGTILVGLSTGHIQRSTNGGASFSDIDVSAYSSLGTFHCTEYGGSVGGSVGVLVIADISGAYLFSLNDGATWAKSSVLAASAAGNPVKSNKARG